jgi:hypothetical protein
MTFPVLLLIMLKILVSQRCPGFNVRPSGAGMHFPGAIAARRMFLDEMAGYPATLQIANVMGVHATNTKPVVTMSLRALDCDRHRIAVTDVSRDRLK